MNILTCIYINTHLCIHVYMCIYVYVHMCLYMYVFMYLHMHTSIIYTTTCVLSGVCVFAVFVCECV